MNSNKLKEVVREKYSLIAKQSKETGGSSCCGTSGCCSSVDYTVFSENYSELEGYAPDADLNLGCGVPTQFAGIRKGDSVLDLGSGAGNDCFVARAIVGDEGSVTGLDFTDEMLKKAEENKVKLGFENVQFIKGDIEDMPFSSSTFDVVISNCVLNLVPDKGKAFTEIFRVLKDKGHFCVSDVVTHGEIPEKMKKDAEMYAGCVAGVIEMDDYVSLVEKAGFKNITIHKKKEIELPDSTLKSYLTNEEIEKFQGSDTGIFSITVSAYKS